MTEGTFVVPVTHLNKNMKKRNIVLLLDNAASHSQDLNLSIITLQYLPPNVTNKLQALNLRIIRTLKARYRKLLSKHIVVNMEKCVLVTELT